MINKLIQKELDYIINEIKKLDADIGFITTLGLYRTDINENYELGNLRGQKTSFLETKIILLSLLNQKS